MKSQQQRNGSSSTRTKTCYVYYLLDPSNDDLLYVGRGFYPGQRKRVFEKRTGRSVKLGTCQRFSDFGKACLAEIKAIARHEPPFNKNLVSASGNFGNIGTYHHSAEIKERIRANSSQYRHSPEVKARLRLASLGNQHGKGKKRSAESIAQVLATKKAKREASHAAL